MLRRAAPSCRSSIRASRPFRPPVRRYTTETESVIFEVNRAGRVDELRRAIAAQPVERLPVDEYQKLAEKTGLSHSEANEALDALHRTGAVLRLAEVPGVIFTRPENLRQAILHVLDPSGELTTARQVALKAEIAKAEAELGPLIQKSEELHKKAHRSARRWAWFGALYLTLQGAAVARLTWWEFSWDIMEPISYLLSFSTCVIGAVYFAATRSDYSYENAWDRFVRKKAEKLGRRRGVDLKKLGEGKAKLQELRAQLATLGNASKPAASV